MSSTVICEGRKDQFASVVNSITTSCPEIVNALESHVGVHDIPRSGTTAPLTKVIPVDNTSLNRTVFNVLSASTSTKNAYVTYSQIAIFGVCVVPREVTESTLLSVYGVVNSVDASSCVVYVLVDKRSDTYVPVIVCVIVVGVGMVSFNLNVNVISLLSPGKSEL